MVTQRGLAGSIGAVGFTFLHAIVKRVEKSVGLHFGRSKARRGRGGGAVTLTHTRTRDIRQKRKKIWRTDWTAAVADVSAAAVARVVHEIG